MSETHGLVKRIDEICGEFDSRVETVGIGWARAELAKSLAESEDRITALRAQVETMRDALEAAPAYENYDRTNAFLRDCISWNTNHRTPALAGTAAPKTAANVTALIEAIKAILELNKDTAGSHRKEIFEIGSNAIAAQFEKAGQE